MTKYLLGLFLAVATLAPITHSYAATDSGAMQEELKKIVGKKLDI